MGFSNTLSTFLLNPTVNNIFNIFSSLIKDNTIEEVENYPFSVDIHLKKKSEEDFQVNFTVIDNVEKEILSSDTMNFKKGIRAEKLSQGKVITFTEGKISERGERLIYSSSIHFEEYTLFHERMVIRLPF